MDRDEYISNLEQFEECSTQNLIALRQWTSTVALPWLWQEMGGAILTPRQKHPNAKTAPAPKVLAPLPDAEALRKGLMVSVADRERMPLEASYYHAQLTMLDSEAKHYCDGIDGVSRVLLQSTALFAEQAVMHSLHGALKELMRIAMVLLEDAGAALVEVPGYYGAGRRQYEMAYEVYRSAQQMIYGAYSGMAYADRAPHTPIAVVRTAIELRLRDAFCVYGYEDPSRPDELIPIDMSKLFEAIKLHARGIDFAVDIHDVWKIYRWSNFYLHGGARDLPWVPGFLLRYMHILFAGLPADARGNWSVHSGIRMKRETWHKVRAELKPKNTPIPFAQRLLAAWRTLTNKTTSPLQLPEADTECAHCKFRD